MKTIACTLLAAATLMGAATTAQARSPEDAVVSARIVYGDLDLSKPAGRATLDRRIDSASRDLCPVIASSDPRAHAKLRACRIQVRESANEKLAAVMDRHIRMAEAPSAD